eukprot:scaffold76054_cov77-Cyclotella_meneghiniana.AAC.1
MAIHSVQILAMVVQRLLLHLMKFLHITAQFILLIANCFWLVIIFWPMFYYKIFSDPKGRSIISILSNPGNLKTLNKTTTTTKAQQFKTIKNNKTLRFYNRSRLVFTAPASQGAYAHIDERLKDPYLDSLLQDLYYKQIYYDDPLRMKTPYEFVSKRPIEPPDGMLFDVIVFVAVVLTFLWPVLCGCNRLRTTLL